MRVSLPSKQTVSMYNRPAPPIISFGCFFIRDILLPPRARRCTPTCLQCKLLTSSDDAVPRPTSRTRAVLRKFSGHSVARSGKRHSSHHLRPVSLSPFCLPKRLYAPCIMRPETYTSESNAVYFWTVGVIGSESASEAAPYVNSRGQIKGEGGLLE